MTLILKHILTACLLLGSCLMGKAMRAQSAEPPQHPFDLRPQAWKRHDKPVLSAYATKQAWSRVVLYSPHVIHHVGKFHMWYLGTSTGSRSSDIALGYAQSSDGLIWKEHPDNPVLTGKDVAWGTLLQTPFVLFDQEEKIFKMWFVSGNGAERDERGKILRMDQQLSYATSSNGIQWKVHPRPLYRSGRSPSVIKQGPQKYRMWMNSSPSPNHPWDDLYKNIYQFTSTDGVTWQRGAEPIIRPTGNARSCVYPFVLHEGSRYFMWYGCHVSGGRFELYCSTSLDGREWKTQHDRAAFPPARDRERFDGRYTSTPCLVRTPDRFLLYYSARDWKNEYVRPDGTRGHDAAGVYAHIGVATLERP